MSATKDAGKVKVEWYGDKLEKKIEANLAYTVKAATLDLKRRSSNQAPVDTGDLRGNASAAFERTVIASATEGNSIETPTEGLTGRVGFTLPYARVQHEEMQYNHPKGGKAKYLEDPANAMRSKYETAINKAVIKGIKP